MVAATFQDLKDELLNFRFLQLVKFTAYLVEKVFWIILALIGMLWFLYCMTNQFMIWNTNKTVISKSNTKLSDLDYPALSICYEAAAKYGIAERLGNYIDHTKPLKNQHLQWIK